MSEVRYLGIFPDNVFTCPLDESKRDFVNGGNAAPYNEMWTKLSDVMGFYWRVKKWEINVNANWTHPNFDNQISINPFIEIEVFHGKWIDELNDILIGEDADEEFKLICGTKNPFIFDVYLGNDREDNPIYEQIIENAHFVCAYHGYAINKHNQSERTGWFKLGYFKDLMPCFYKNLDSNPEYQAGISFIFQAGLTDTSVVTMYPAGYYENKICGNFKLEMFQKTFNNNLWTPVDLQSYNGSINATLKATEYFEYDPNDGKGPIYNKHTGARIRNDV